MNVHQSISDQLFDLVGNTMAVFMVYLFVEANLSRLPQRVSRPVILTAVYCGLTLLALSMGVEVMPGVLMDPRFGIVVAATLTLGWRSGLAVGLCAGAVRLAAGGVGAVPGSLGVVLAWAGTWMCLVWHQRAEVRRTEGALPVWVVVVSSLMGALAPVMGLLWLAQARGLSVDSDLFVAIGLAQFVVAVLLWLAIALTTSRTQALRDLQQSNQALLQSFRQTIGALASAVLHRDPGAATHQRRVAALAVAVGQKLGLSGLRLEGLEMAALIHDIGQIEIPVEILSRPGLLTDAELGLVRLHPQMGYEILKDVSTPWPLAEIVYQHHENLDGSGYPRQLSGDAILLEARILRVCDIVEAMSSHRAFRPAVGLKQALDELRQMSGKQLDPQVVQACLALFERDGYQLPGV